MFVAARGILTGTYRFRDSRGNVLGLIAATYLGSSLPGGYAQEHIDLGIPGAANCKKIQVGRRELKKDSSRPTRTEKRFESVDPN